MADDRSYPARPILAVSAAIIRAGRVLVAMRARPPARGLYSLPGGVVEAGESLHAALMREVHEETRLEIAPLDLAGTREIIVRDAQGRVERHFVILAFAARWIAGEPRLNAELSQARWMAPQEVLALPTTEGLAEIMTRALARLDTGD